MGFGLRREQRLWGWAGAFALLGGSLWLAGCSGAAGSLVSAPAPVPAPTPGPTAPQVTVSVTGGSQVRAGATMQMTATVANATNQAVTWGVNGIAGGAAGTGTISAAGLYTAPALVPAAGSVTIDAVSAAAPTVSGTQVESVLNPLPVISSALGTQSVTGTTYTLDVQGSGFVVGSTIQMNGSSVATTVVSGTELQAAITVPTGTATVSVVVVNPNPGGSGSAAAQAALRTVVVSLASAARLLDQTTFGPTLSTIQHVQQVGLNGYLTEQFNMPPTLMATIPAAPVAICQNEDEIPCVQSEWWQGALTAPDQLRQRVAFALSEMFVISTNGVEARSVVPFQNLLLTNAFGNFSTLMQDVTLSTGMGAYLNMLHSNKPGSGQIANENYAREFMQLFTIGLVELNQDGTPQLDGLGKTIPTYTELQVEAFARAYTGWTYATPTGGVPTHFPNYAVNFDHPMVAVESAHDQAAKMLLAGTVLPAGGTAEQDLAGAMANVFSQPNVGPFVSKQLIQHLVASNPSPAYVGRVAAVFADNGLGVRGDMKAVIKAILTDPEARNGDAAGNAEGGHLREAMLYVANVMRALGYVNNSATGDYGGASGASAALGERPYSSPSVFNFFLPDYVIPGSTLLAPEFGQENTATAILRLNIADNLVYSRVGGFRVDLSATSALGMMAGNPGNLVDSLAILFMHGQMPAAMRTAIVNHIATLTDPSQRVRVATYLTITSPQYKIIH